MFFLVGVTFEQRHEEVKEPMSLGKTFWGVGLACSRNVGKSL